MNNRKAHIVPEVSKMIVIGVGGTGSYLVQGLAKMIAGYQLDINVQLVDPDVVEDKNCARQNFYPWETGQSKAMALAYRLNQQYGLKFGAIQSRGEDQTFNRGDSARLIVTCVDTVEARKYYKDKGPWLDLGNGLETGQALYGTTDDRKKIGQQVRDWDKAPHVGHLPNPYLLARMGKLKSPKKKAPSCADTPFAEQGVFANEWAAAAGLTILHQLLVQGELTTPCIYFDTAKGRMTPAFITKDYLKGA